MKKILVLLLVLGFATASQAAVTGLIFTVNGEPQPAEITIAVDQTIELDFELAAGHDMLGYNVEWEILGGRSIFAWAGVTFPTEYTFSGSKITTNPAPLPNKVRMTGSNLSGAPVGPAVIMQGLILKCIAIDAEGQPTIVTMTTRATTKVDGVNVVSGTLLHTLTIHQVPEPMTMMLLGLGSLFLVRRKK